MAAKLMHAVQYDSYGGGAAGLKHVEVPIPAPKKNEVLLKLEAASLNPVDWKIQKGELRPLFPRKFPQIPDVGHDAPHHRKEDALFCSGLEDCSGRSVFWSLMPPDQGGICAPVDPSFSLSFSSIQHPTVRVPQSAGYSIPSLQPNILDGRFLTVSPPFPQSHCL